MSERPEFRDLLAFLNQDVETALPTSYEAIQTWVFDVYYAEKARIQQASALLKVHFTVNLWTSTNHLALLAGFSIIQSISIRWIDGLNRVNQSD